MSVCRTCGLMIHAHALACCVVMIMCRWPEFDSSLFRFPIGSSIISFHFYIYIYSFLAGRFYPKRLTIASTLSYEITGNMRIIWLLGERQARLCDINYLLCHSVWYAVLLRSDWSRMTAFDWIFTSLRPFWHPHLHVKLKWYCANGCVNAGNMLKKLRLQSQKWFQKAKIK